MSLYKKTAHELHELLQKKEISAVELTKNIFERIDEKEKSDGAFLEITKNQAEETAKLVDEKISRGEKISALEGIPARLKIIFARRESKQLARQKFLKILFRLMTQQLSRN